MSALAWICAYLLGAIITYGLCWNYTQTDHVRAQLDVTPDSERAYQIVAIGICAVGALLWPVTAAIALADLIPTRTGRRKAHALDVGQTITINGHPMLITSISYREHPGIGCTASITCASAEHTEGDPK